MDRRNRNTALVLIAAGLFILLGNVIGFLTVTALLIVWFGIHKVKTGDHRPGYILLAIGVLFLTISQFALIIAIILISLGYFLLRTKQLQRDNGYVQKHNILESIRWNRDPWVLRSHSVWSIVGEVNLDLSLAISDQHESTLIFQGVVGDIDIIVPDDIGVWIESTFPIGQAKIGPDKESGFMLKKDWKSANYEFNEYKVHIIVSYLVGDLNVTML